MYKLRDKKIFMILIILLLSIEYKKDSIKYLYRVFKRESIILKYY